MIIKTADIPTKLKRKCLKTERFFKINLNFFKFSLLQEKYILLPQSAFPFLIRLQTCSITPAGKDSMASAESLSSLYRDISFNYEYSQNKSGWHFWRQEEEMHRGRNLLLHSVEALLELLVLTEISTGQQNLWIIP